MSGRQISAAYGEKRQATKPTGLFKQHRQSKAPCSCRWDCMRRQIQGRREEKPFPSVKSKGQPSVFEGQRPKLKNE